MCGICGIASRDPSRSSERDLVTTMRDTMEHRGPDGAGIAELRGATLAHRRLSIIDLEHGDQPMTNEDRTIWVTFNGEIYNYPALRAELAARGHCFRTRSDTEVLVHAYEEYGDDFVTRLNGMFAFALLDVPRQRLLLARDPVGIKPLFYAIDGDRLAFASEIKGVLPALRRSPALRYESLQEYLVFRYVAWDRTWYEDVHRVPPGHVGIWEDGRLTLRRYWRPRIVRARPGLDLDAAAVELDRELSQAVEDQLISDVPLGAFCSGGVDSGLVTTYAARGARGFQSFSVGFHDPVWDETALAHDTARRAGADHHVIVATEDAIEQLLPRLIRYHDEPLSHPNSVPLYLLSELAREHVKVVLTGEGADELFCGYPRYHLARLRGAFGAVPRSWRTGTATLLRALPGHRAAKAALLLPRTLEDSLLLNSAYVEPALVEALLGCPVTTAFDARRAILAETLDPSDPAGSLSRFELLTYLTCCLDRMDRMSMAHGLEGRVPFLDNRVLQWGLGVPSTLKLGLRTNKRVVKRLAQGRLTSRIVDGRKSGFGLPLDEWFRGPVLGGVLDRLRDPQHPAATYFDPLVLRKVLADHESRAVNAGDLLWLLANVFLWVEANGAASRVTSRWN